MSWTKTYYEQSLLECNDAEMLDMEYQYEEWKQNTLKMYELYLIEKENGKEKTKQGCGNNP